MELKVSCRYIDNVQPTNSNVKLLQCYGIFLTSVKLVCTKVINTLQPCDDPAHQRTLQETLHISSARWGRDPGITSPYAKTQDIYIYIYICTYIYIYNICNIYIKLIKLTYIEYVNWIYIQKMYNVDLY